MKRENTVELILICLLMLICICLAAVQVNQRNSLREVKKQMLEIQRYQVMVNSYVEWSLSNGVTNAVPTLINEEPQAE